MCALVDDSLLDSGQTIEDNCAGTALDIVDGGLYHADANGGGDDPAKEGCGNRGHVGRLRGGRLDGGRRQWLECGGL